MKSELTCPGCQAIIELGAVPASRPESCPFCGTDFGDLINRLPSTTVQEVSPGRTEKDSRRRHELPAGSRIVVLAPDPGQLVLQIPPGKSGAAGFLLFFAIFWNGIVLAVASGFLFAGGQNQNVELWLLIPFFGIFFLVGLIVLIFGISLKYTRTMLLLETGRAVMQKTLFRYQSLKEITLSAGARAELVESYRQNDQPVYAVAIVSGDESLKFGTSLSDAEKEALLKIINEHVGYKQLETPSGSVPGLRQETIDAVEISPEELSPGSLLTVTENRADELVFSFPLIPSSTFKMVLKLVTTVMGLFATGMLIFLAVVVGNVAAGQDFPILFLIPLGVMFFLPFVFAFLISRLNVTIGINREHVVQQITSGPFRRRKTWSSSAVTGVTIRSHDMRSHTGSKRHRRNRSNAASWSFCSLDIGRQSNWLAFGPVHPFCHEVAGLVRYQLLQLGIPLIDDRGGDSSIENESTDTDD
ncbi:MAG: hypothetical protein O2955_07030 [Planctomycetota bacterium]|nr:hypothetical protein [Planctomycetota bacterium]MDA1212250.1 hypothetical protein [Planctomycetota bacterium]